MLSLIECSDGTTAIRDPGKKKQQRSPRDVLSVVILPQFRPVTRL